MELQRAVSDLVDLEVNQRVDALESAIKELDDQITRWSLTGTFTVAHALFGGGVGLLSAPRRVN